MNHCTFEGRISGTPEPRTLPSGDEIVVFRLVVPRPDEQRVDTIDCLAATSRLRARALGMASGTQVHLEGRLHRRFWRGPQGIASRYEVMVGVLRRVP